MKKNTIIALVVALILIFGLFYFTNKSRNNPAGSTDTTKDVEVKLPAGPAVETKKMANGTEYLADVNGMTLYTFSDDGKMKSNCTGECLAKWPAFIYDNKNFQTSEDSISRKMNVFKRADGKFQYAFGEQPVYYYMGDKKAGETNGDGLNSGKWSVVKITN